MVHVSVFSSLPCDLICSTMTDDAVVTSAYFYTSPERPENCSLTYSSSGVNDVQTSSAAQASTNAMQNVATSPQLDSDSLLEVPEMLRPRSNSAPMILYQQVALELRGISDEFNREFMRDEVWTRPVIAHTTHTPTRLMALCPELPG